MQKNSTSKMHIRMLVVLVAVFMMGFLGVVGRLFYLQIIEGESYQLIALEQQTRSTPIGAKRGVIYDTNGNILAQSATVWNVCFSPAQLDEKKINLMAEGLSKILDVDKEKIIADANARGSFYKRIKMRVERSVTDEVLAFATENDIDGIFFEPDTKRYYKYGSLASTLLGFTNYDNEGAYGLEAYYNSVLSGTPGMVVSLKDAVGADMDAKNQQMYAAKDGNSIVLTIDESIQHFVERNIKTAMIEHNIGNGAAGIVMDVNTGAIVAMATEPNFDPNEPYALSPGSQALLEELSPESQEYKDLRRDLQYAQWRNKAISDPYEPGSVFKIVTAAGAVDNNLVNINDHFFCSGELQVADRTISCWKHGGHGDQDFIQGMQNSCNPVFMTIGQRMGGPVLYDYMKSFGLMAPTGIDLPGEAEGIPPTLANLSKDSMVELSSTSFGQSFKVTPLQLITAVSAAVNGGKLMQPYILKQVRDAQGNVIETTQPTVQRQVISEESSKIMQLLVESVVDGGSGRNAAIPGYRIGGKTGTSEKLDLKFQTGLEKYVLSFVGFVPMENPQYAVLVMLDEPAEAAYGSTIAAPVVGAIMNEMLSYLGYEPQLTEEELAEKEVKVPSLIGRKPHDAQSALIEIGLATRFVGEGSTVIRQIPQEWQTMPKGGTVILYTDEEKIATDISVPDVVGLNAQEANKIITEKRLNVEIRGVTADGVETVVEQQWPLAQTEATTGDVVIITLIEKPKETEKTE